MVEPPAEYRSKLGIPGHGSPAVDTAHSLLIGIVMPRQATPQSGASMMNADTYNVVDAAFPRALHFDRSLAQKTGTARLPATAENRDLPHNGRVLSFAEGRTIFSPGEPARLCYRILSGCVEIRPGRGGNAGEHETIICETDEIFGEVAALSGGMRHSRALAVQPVLCAVYSPDAFVRRIEHDREEGLSYAQTIIARQKRASEHLPSCIVKEKPEDETEAASARSLQSSLELHYAIEDLLGRLEHEQEMAISFARKLVRSLTERSSCADAGLRCVA